MLRNDDVTFKSGTEMQYLIIWWLNPSYYYPVIHKVKGLPTGEAKPKSMRKVLLNESSSSHFALQININFTIKFSWKSNFIQKNLSKLISQ